MAELNVTDVLSEIGVTAAAAHKLLQGGIPLVDALDIAPIEALVSKIGFLSEVGMGLTNPLCKDAGDDGIARTWFMPSKGE